MTEYLLGTSDQTLIFEPQVIDHFRAHRQINRLKKEAGGQLFAKFERGAVVIVEATGPRRTDQRSRTNYQPDRQAEQREIDERFARGLHYVGDWHSHPEGVPQPSWSDEKSIRDSVSRSTHQLSGFLLVIVGAKEPPEGLYVALFTRTASMKLSPKRAGTS